MKYNTTLVVGKNKTGKTRNILFNEVEEKINNGEDLVLLDSRQEYYNHFYKKLKENNYDIKVVNLNNPLKGDGWNPLSDIYFIYHHKNQDTAIELLEKMAKNIFYEEDTNNDPFWCEMASNLFIGLSLILIRLSKEIKGSRIIAFSTIMLLLNLVEKKYKEENISYYRKYIEKLHPSDPVYIALSSIAYAPPETRGSILAVFKVKMNQYVMRENLVKSFLSNSVSGSKVNNTNRKYAIFLIGENSLNKLINIFIEQIFSQALDAKRNVSIVLDGYENLPTLYNLDYMIDQANHSNISLYLTSLKENKLEKIERVIETKEIFESAEDEPIELPNLDPLISYEDDFLEILNLGLKNLINNK